jgi:hypothetical protein
MLKTREVCLAAVQQDSDALYYVPSEHRTEDLYILAVSKKGYLSNILIHYI